jgi:glycosyltransferase involved in cell wall biosynthesis
MLTVICPIYNEEKYIARCIESIMQQDYPKDDLEVLFVDGMSTDRTREIIVSYLPQCPYLRVLDNPDKIVPYAMNKGISEAKGDIIMRIDAHTFYEPNYCSAIVRRLKELDADNVGCVCKTDVLNKTPKTLAIREVLSNKFGVGNSAFRTGIDGVKKVDTVPFGCWPKRVFEKYGQYDVRLVRNQDIELSKRIINGGGKIFIIPDTFCTYLARETFRGLAKNNFGNGKWNILTVYYTKTFSSLSLRHFIPLLFLLSLIVPLLLAFLWWQFVLISVASLIAYMGLLSMVSLKLALSKHLNFVYLFVTFVVLHISYGWGSLIGILKLPFVKR